MKLRSIQLTAALLLLGATLRAASPEELQFQKLKQERAKTPAGASEMVDQRYRTSLEQMLKLPGVAAQPELARQIQAELQAAAGAKAAVAATATPKPLNAPTGRVVTKSELKKLFENSEWQCTTKGLQDRTFTFTKDGKVALSKPGAQWERYHFWDVVAPDVLKLSVRDLDKDRKAPFRALRVNFDAKTAKTDATLGGEPAGDLTIEYDHPLDRKK